MSNKEGVILLRVSTVTQDYEGQRIDLEKFAQSKGYTKTHIIEAKESGLADYKQREGLQRLIELIESNPKIDAVFATEMSRVSRKQHILHRIKDYFISNRIQFYLKDGDFSLLDEITREPKQDGILFTLYGYFAESEATTKKKRFSRAKAALLENGFYIGGKVLFGFDVSKEEKSKSKLIVNEEHANQVRKIFDWYLNGIRADIPNPSIKRISKECILQGFHQYTHSKRNVNKLLKEEGYLGEKETHNKRKNPEAKDKKGANPYIITTNKIRYPTQIITIEVFEKVQAKLKSNISEADKGQHSTILARLIKCPKCGNHLSANYRTSSNLIRHTYRCTGRSKTIGCDSTLSISMPLLDSTVWSVIKTDYDLLKKTIDENNPDERLGKIDKEILIMEEKVDSLKIKNEEIKKRKLSAARKGDFQNYDELELISDNINRELKSWESEIKTQLIEKETIANAKKDALTIFESTIEKIEGSQDLLKKFISLFVSHIAIILHNQRYTVIRIHFKRISETRQTRVMHKRRKYIFDGEIEPEVDVVIDKRHTLDIKAIKTTARNYGVEKDFVYFLTFDDFVPIDFEVAYQILTTDEESRFKLYDAKILNFNKLNVYQTPKQLNVNQIDAEKEQ